jgi:hypothetical protein
VRVPVYGNRKIEQGRSGDCPKKSKSVEVGMKLTFITIITSPFIVAGFVCFYIKAGFIAGIKLAREDWK